MSTESPVRPTRRAAARRRVIDDDSEDDDSDKETATYTSKTADTLDEDAFDPTVQTTRRRSTRHRQSEAPATPHASGRTRRAPKDTSILDSTQGLSPPTSVADSISPIRTQPSKRRSVKTSQAARRARTSQVAPCIQEDAASSDVEMTEATALPTPEPSKTPESLTITSSTRHITPLADITEAALNENVQHYAEPPTPIKQEVKKVDTKITILEKPMDIVVRTRQAAMPVAEPIGPTKRTVITYLVLNNFKSYAGRQEVGPFHACFSSVVGPNGSGKSNVIDSLLFVFGFRASKMRQGKLSALIHNSSRFPDLEYCEVEVHFQEVIDIPGGGHNVVPDSQLVISRRAFKNSSSNYYINQKTSNFTAVTTLLKDRGVDLDHKRFLILQGEVESIAQMKPKAATEHDDGLLEYLEDIIGTSKYKTPIDEAEAETEKLNEVCFEKTGRVQHIEKEKNALEDKKNKALAFIRNENELTSKKSALYQIYLVECNDKTNTTEELLANIKAEYDEEMQKYKGNEDEIKQIEKDFKKACGHYESSEKKSQAILKEAAKLDKDAVKFEEKKKFLANKAKKLEKAVETSRFGAAESATLRSRALDDVERNRVQIAELEQELSTEDRELCKIREGLRGKTQGLSDQMAAKQAKLEPWNAKINMERSAIAVARSELDILRERDNAGATAVAEAEAKIEALQESRDAKSVDMVALVDQKKKVGQDIAQITAQIEDLAAKEPILRSKLSNARQKADEARSSLSASKSQGDCLTGLMRLKETGRISGFHGRLGTLGAIDSKYDIAISTACPSLDNLVVESVEVGQQCIEYLRTNKLGRANFILLDRLPQRDLSPVDTPEGVPRLFDLVRSKDDRFSPAFFSVLQNTLVAKDLNQANRIAYGAKRWRVVTLDGQLIDKSGTMSGGGTRVAKGAMSSKIVADTSKEQVAGLEGDRDTLEQTFAEFQSKQRELDNQLRELNETLPRLETERQKVALGINSLDRNIADARKRVQELNAEQQTSKTDKRRVFDLEKSIQTLENKVEKLQTETAGIEEEIKALQDRIMEIGGVQLRSQKAKVDGLKEQIEHRNEELSSAEVAEVKAEKQRAKHEKTHGEAVADLEKISHEIEEADEELKEHTRNAAGTRRQADEAQVTLETMKEELDALKAKLEDERQALNGGREREIELRNKRDDNEKILKENQAKLRHWHEKLSKLVLQNIDDDGQDLGPLPLTEHSRDELADMSIDELKASIAQLEESTSQGIELSVLSDYRRRVEEHSLRSADLNQALESRDSSKKRLDDLRRLRLEGFMEGFSTISLRLKEMYQMITMGGNAELELVDSLDPFSEGILFSVMPPKKSWKNISNLSGGEKTLSSLALVFALHHYKPTPLYVMDEIDAALDFRNVSIVASYIKERTKNAQFIVISLRNNMFELAARLVGVYKVNHMTKSVTVENRDYMLGPGVQASA